MYSSIIKNLQLIRRNCSKNAFISRLYSHCVILHKKTAPQVNDFPNLDESVTIAIEWPASIIKPRIGIIKDNFFPPSWTKYERFCSASAIPFGSLNIHAHNWMEQVKDYDWVIGHPDGSPNRLDELWRKTYIMEQYLGKRCYPSCNDLALYEDKHMQYDALQVLKFPVIPTWISYDEEDALRLAHKLEYPLVSKLITGAGSKGVELINSRSDAIRVIKKAFSPHGRYWHWPYLRQKDYVIFQKFIPNDGYDVRVICVGDMVFGYYRKALPNDFRASGSGICEKRSLPESIIRIAHSVAQSLQAPYLSVDFLRSITGEYYIIEVSHFNQIDTSEQLHVDCVPGAYLLASDGTFSFVSGRFWVQELALKQVCVQYLAAWQGGCSIFR
jgi:glutathione synthase/RimK-type ligase-like ATP-grasp enzyme